MRVLGVSCDYHDAAAALVVDGEVVAAAEQERFSRIKHDPALPTDAIASCLAIAGIGPDDVDVVVFHEKPLLVAARVLAAKRRRGLRSLGEFTAEVPVLLRRNLLVPYRIERAFAALGGRRRPTVRYGEHHLSHAAAAFLPSPFPSAAVLTVEGIGEWATATIGHGTHHRIDLLAEQRYPDSLGLAYSLITRWCGFAPNDGEYKLMGLAPYGEPRYRDALAELVAVGDDGSLRIDGRLARWWSSRRRPHPRLVELLDGPPSPLGAEPGRREADLARSMQALTEDAVLAMAAEAHRLTGERSLCLAGGVALNCVANGRLLREGPFDELWVQPAAGDAGSALGAALWWWHGVEGRPRTADGARDAMGGAALGPSFAPDEVGAWLDGAGVPWRRVGDEGELAGEVAARLADGAVVGWFEGRMELGPRALGHRSILADPRGAEVQRDLNLRVKGRESFRPFAPAVPAERAADWFDLDAPAPYMLITAPVAEARRVPVPDEPEAIAERVAVPRSTIPACTHVDGSARVQTVAAADHPAFHRLLSAFEAATGCPVLLDTSFNVAGEPIVCTPDQALATARRAGLDLLVIGDALIDLPATPPDLASVGGASGDPALTPNRVAIRGSEAPDPNPVRGMGGASGDPALTPNRVAIRGSEAPDPNPVRGVGGAGGDPVRGMGGASGEPGPPAGGWREVPGPRSARSPRGPTGALRSLGPALAAAAVLTVVLAVRGRLTDPAALAVAATAVAVVAVLSTWQRERFDRVVGAVGHVAGRTVSTVLFGLLWVPVVALPSLAELVLRIDPLETAGRRPGSRWIERGRRDVRPRERWAPEPALVPVAPRVRRRRRVGLVAVTASLALVAGAGAYVVTHTRFTSFGILSPAVAAESVAPPFPPGTPGAYRNASWYPQHKRDLRYLWTVATAWDPFSMLRIHDVATPTVNVVDGVRRTWHPPPCGGCHRLRVWFYGGSAAFGLGQRDLHTIASELARLAAADGVALDVDNRGEPGWLHWQDAQRYAWDVATYGPPDAVIFYDGFNELYSLEDDSDRRDPVAPIDPYSRTYWRNLTGDAKAPHAPDGGGMLPTPTLQPTPGDEAEVIARRYERSRKISATTADATRTPVDWFWQPNRWTRPRNAGEPDSGGFADRARLSAEVRTHLDPAVHDLSDAFDGTDDPLYYDDVHHNEEGARLVAEAMWAQLRDRYRALDEGR
jgi:carbamoyltransferase